MKKNNNYIKVGIVLNAFSLFFSRFTIIPDFILGLCLGAGISIMLLGIYAEKHDISKLRSYKLALINKVRKR
jgi:hypothetical protein